MLKNEHQPEEKLRNDFKTFLNNIEETTEESLNAIVNLFLLKEYSKGELLFKSGQIENEIRYIAHGIIKITIESPHDYYVFDFREEKDVMCDTYSMFENRPSLFTMEAMNECTVLTADKESFVKLMKENFELAILFSKCLNRYQDKIHRRQNIYRSFEADERYRKFCQDYPSIVRIAKLGDIASFLSITQQSLSRIRKVVHSSK